MRVSLPPRLYFVATLGVSSAVSVLLLVLGSLSGHTTMYLYLLLNLALAWIPFGLSLWLSRTLRRKLWSSWEALAVTIAWIIFLPNSFYMISDLIHIAEATPDQIVLSAVVHASFVLTGLMLGFASLYLIHVELRKRLSFRGAAYLVGLTLFISSVAIYVGRDLRWNSWDVLTNPGGLLFDLSDRLLHPDQYLPALMIIAPFFLLLTSLYFAMLGAIRVVRLQAQGRA